MLTLHVVCEQNACGQKAFLWLFIHKMVVTEKKTQDENVHTSLRP